MAFFARNVRLAPESLRRNGENDLLHLAAVHHARTPDRRFPPVQRHHPRLKGRSHTFYRQTESRIFFPLFTRSQVGFISSVVKFKNLNNRIKIGVYPTLTLLYQAAHSIRNDLQVLEILVDRLYQKGHRLLLHRQEALHLFGGI